MKKPILLSFLCLLFLAISSQAETATCDVQTPTVLGSSLVCGSGTSTISLLGENTHLWYTSSMGGVAFATSTGTSFTTSTLSANTNYWVVGLNGSCESQRILVEITKVNKPAQPTLVTTNLPCGSGSAQIKVSSEFENIWYTSSVGGIAIDTTGQVFQTPTITGATSFWVTGYTGDEGCESERVETVVTVNGIPEKPKIRVDDFLPYGPELYFGGYTFLNSSYYVSIELINGNISGPPGIPYTNIYIFTVAGLNDRGIGVDWNRNTVGQMKLVNISELGCKSDTSTFSYSVPGVATGFDRNQKIDDSIQIFPNPNNGVFSIESESNQIETITIFTADGKREQLDGYSAQYIITSSKGLLQLQLKTQKGLINKRILVE